MRASVCVCVCVCACVSACACAQNGAEVVSWSCWLSLPHMRTCVSHSASCMHMRIAHPACTCVSHSASCICTVQQPVHAAIRQPLPHTRTPCATPPHLWPSLSCAAGRSGTRCRSRQRTGQGRQRTRPAADARHARSLAKQQVHGERKKAGPALAVRDDSSRAVRDGSSRAVPLDALCKSQAPHSAPSPGVLRTASRCVCPWAYAAKGCRWHTARPPCPDSHAVWVQPGGRCSNRAYNMTS